MSRWQTKAACRGKPTSWWFTPPARDGQPTREHELALRCCERCTVTQECTEAGKHQVGMWAGKYFATRHANKGRGGQVRCDRCGELFDRDNESVDRTCSSCLPPLELRRREKRDAKRRYRRQGTRVELERFTEAFERLVELSEDEYGKVDW